MRSRRCEAEIVAGRPHIAPDRCGTGGKCAGARWKLTAEAQGVCTLYYSGISRAANLASGAPGSVPTLFGQRTYRYGSYFGAIFSVFTGCLGVFSKGIISK